MPISQKYVFRVFSNFFWLSLFVFAALFVMINFVQIVNQGALSGFSFYFLAKSILYLMPNIVSMSLPLAFLMAVLLGLGRLSRDGEITALRAGGFSFGEMLGVVFRASLGACVLLLFVNNWLAPRSLKRSGDYTTSMMSRVTKIELRPATFQNISNWVIYSREVDSGTRALRGVRLVRRTGKNDAPSLVTAINAEKGAYRVLRERGIEISLENGQFSQTDYTNQQKLLYGDFASYRTLIPFFSGNENARRLHANELSTPLLFQRLGDPALDAGTALRYRIELLSRPALALTPAVFFLIGAPLGVVLGRKSRTAGFALSLLVIFFYYGFSITALVLARKYAWLVPWGIFAPAAVCAGLGLWLWKKRLYAR